MKQKLIYLFTLLLLMVSCSVDRFTFPVDTDGKDGNTTLIVSSILEPGNECPAGGTSLDFGIDKDNDGVLSPEEITSAAFVCNGTDGVDGQNGQDGLGIVFNTLETESGYLVQYGFDLNTDGELSEEEITDVIAVTHGLDGNDGQDGTVGPLLIRLVEFEESEQCPNGGVTILAGLDTDNDGELSEEEITDKVSVCNGTNGQDGNDGADGTDGVDGQDGYNTLIRSLILEPGELCEFGGIIFYYGLDSNRNEILDEIEIQGQETICNVSFECDECNPQCDDCEEPEEEFETICHKIKIGNDWVFVELFIPESAIQAHLDHGDSLGECQD